MFRLSRSVNILLEPGREFCLNAGKGNRTYAELIVLQNGIMAVTLAQEGRAQTMMHPCYAARIREKGNVDRDRIFPQQLDNFKLTLRKVTKRELQGTGLEPRRRLGSPALEGDG